MIENDVEHAPGGEISAPPDFIPEQEERVAVDTVSPTPDDFLFVWKNRNLRVTVQKQARHTGAGRQHTSSIDTSSDSPRCAVMQAPGFNMGCPPGHGG